MPTELEIKKREARVEAGDEKIAALEEHLIEHEVEEIADHSRLRVPTDLRGRPARGRDRNGAAGGLAVVVRSRGGVVDQLFGIREGGAAPVPAGGAVAPASGRVRLYFRFPAGGAGAPAAVYRKHDNGGVAGSCPTHREKFLPPVAVVVDRLRGESDRDAGCGIVQHLRSGADPRDTGNHHRDQPRDRSPRFCRIRCSSPSRPAS